jgi:hypothetical protein
LYSKGIPIAWELRHSEVTYIYEKYEIYARKAKRETWWKITSSEAQLSVGIQTQNWKQDHPRHEQSDS